MKKIIYFAAILLLGAAACSKSEIPTWDAKPRMVYEGERHDDIFILFFAGGG